MKTKILTFLLIIFSFLAYSQEANKTKTLTITAGAPAAGWGSLNVDYSISLYYITSATPVTLTSSWSISALGSVYSGLTYNFYYDADCTVGANNITFFGVSLTDAQALKDLYVTATYVGSGWRVVVLPDMSVSNGTGIVAYDQLELQYKVKNNDIDPTAAIAYTKFAPLVASMVPVLNSSGFIVGSTTPSTKLTYIDNVTSDVQAQLGTKITTGNVTTSDISAVAGIKFSQMESTTAGRALVSDGSGFVTTASVTSTEMGYLSGVTSSVQTQINASASKALTRGYMYIGDVSAETAPIDVSGNAKLLIGNGTTAASQSISGDATIDNSGVLTIAAGVVTPSNQSLEARKELLVFNLSTIHGASVGIKIRIPYACEVNYISLSVVESPITDALIVNFNDDSNNNMGGSAIPSGDITVGPGTVVGQLEESTVTSNNNFAAGEYLIMDTRKSTATTGIVLVSIELQRVD